ncbi:MAG: TonB-dependent receptor plug domain-containing protein, partial [Bacteroidia bacterium]
DRKKTLGIETLIGFDGNVETGTGDRIDGGKQSQLDAALFVSAEKKITSYFLMRGGLRYAYNSAFESPLLYSLQTRFTLPNSQVFKLAVGKGFRAPSLKELYLDLNDSRHEVFGNPNLQSETSHSLTGSYTKYFKSDKLKFATNVEGFYNDIVDKIDLVVSGPISAKYYNIGVFRSVGGGINQKVEGKKLAINTSFNYTGIYNGIEGSQKKYYFSPQLVVNPTMKFPKLNGSLNLFFNYFGASSRVFSDSTGKSVNLREQDAYSMLDLTYNKSFLNKKLRIGVGARNILNVITIDSNNTEVGAHTPSTSYVSVSPGRTYFINVRYEFFKK